MDFPLRTPQKIMMIAGEQSGELHGSRVVHELKKYDSHIDVFGIGGDLMKQEGMHLLFHIRDTSFMGFIEVIKHLSHIRRVFRLCVSELKNHKPDVLVLIDYPGFNLRLAKKAKALGIRVLYYISPQVWAWGKGRIPKMKKLVDQFAVILPFEKNIYEKAGIPVEFVGHPLLEILTMNSSRDEFLRKHSLPDKRILLLLPGSREQEIKVLLPTMVNAAMNIQQRSDCIIAIGAAQNVPLQFYQKIIMRNADIHLIHGETHELMQHSFTAIVASGTATLETAIYLKPMVIVYKASRLSYEIAKRLVSISHIGIVNILANQTIVPELIQHDFTKENLVKNVLPLFTDEFLYHSTVEKLKTVTSKLGTPGASERVAKLILGLH